MQKENIQLSHVLYRVNDLHESVFKLQKEGFVVEYGTDPEKAYNAIIWFEEGIFVEIYTNSGLSLPIKCMMKLFGYQFVLDRINKWENIENGWCEWSLESRIKKLDIEREFFKNEKEPFKFHKAKRRDINNQILKWELLMPNDIYFPFIMSAYTPNPRPRKIEHPNGIQSVSKIIIGKDNLNISLLDNLLLDKTGLQLVKDKIGLQSIEFENSTLKIEHILI